MKIGFIGSGHIATALARGWAAGAEARRDEKLRDEAPGLVFYDADAERAAALAAECRGTAAASLADLVAGSDLLIVAVRPTVVGEVLTDVAPLLESRPLVSLAAGVTLAQLREHLHADAAVARVMPNLAASLCRGTFLVVPGTLTSAEAQRLDEALSLIGQPITIAESEIDIGTAVSGCMPGFMGLIVAGFAQAGVAGGLGEDEARRIALSAVHGAAAVVAANGDPAAIMAATATPGGMTAAGLEQLQADGLEQVLESAVQAATLRARQLTK